MRKYDVKDIGLAPSGKQKIDWVKAHMPLLSSMEEEFRRTKPFEGVKISLSIHMEAKTAYLCKVLRAGGADLRATGSNVLSTQDDVVAALADEGVSVFALHGEDEDSYFSHIAEALAHKPNIIIDDGGDLVSYLHEKDASLGTDVWGGCEETTTGIVRLNAMAKEGVLKFPMMAVNDADCKHLFDNRYGTGQSVWDSLMRNTNLIVAGKIVVVAGYGWCSRGIAMRAAALGGQVVVTEVDPVKAMEAKMDGFSVMPMEKAAKAGDFFITATGCKDTIAGKHIDRMKDGAILANAGHFNVEIDVDFLEDRCVEKKEQRKNITGYRMKNGRWINLLGQGRLVNIAAADGHPAEIMDLSFAIQVLSALYIKENHKKLPAKVIKVPESVDREVAMRWLQARNLKIDRLTEDQETYLDSWKV